MGKWNLEKLKNHKGMLGKHQSDKVKIIVGNVQKNRKHQPQEGFQNKHKDMVSSKARDRARKKMMGKNHYNWKGGITPINYKIRNSLQYKLWRKSVFERDNYTCIFCGLKNGNGKTIILNVDHIKPFKDYPELRFAIDNGRTLCQDCHRKIHYEV